MAEKKPEACECGCGGCEQQERYEEYILRKLKEEREAKEQDANL